MMGNLSAQGGRRQLANFRKRGLLAASNPHFLKFASCHCTSIRVNFSTSEAEVFSSMCLIRRAGHLFFHLTWAKIELFGLYQTIADSFLGVLSLTHFRTFHLCQQAGRWWRGSTQLYQISLLSGYGNQCKDPMDNNKDCRVGQLTSGEEMFKPCIYRFHLVSTYFKCISEDVQNSGGGGPPVNFERRSQVLDSYQDLRVHHPMAPSAIQVWLKFRS